MVDSKYALEQYEFYTQTDRQTDRQDPGIFCRTLIREFSQRLYLDHKERIDVDIRCFSFDLESNLHLL